MTDNAGTVTVNTLIENLDGLSMAAFVDSKDFRQALVALQRHQAQER
jgi:hypothetical protein